MASSRTGRKHPAASVTATRHSAFPTHWLCASIFFVGIGVYANSFLGQFILDDALGIKGNPNIRGLWPLSRFLGDTRPVVDFTLAINHALGEWDVRGYHAFNLAIHLLAALVLFGIVRRILERPPFAERYPGRSQWIALAAALIWLTHPLCTQAVTYVIQRAESMMALFYLLTLYCLVRGVDSSRPSAWYAAAVPACALGMGCKAVMATAPLVAFLMDGLLLSDSFKEALRRRWPLYIGLVATEGILFLLGVIPGLFVTQHKDPITVGFGMAGVTPGQYACTQPGIILHYLRLAFWPSPLCVDYGWPVAQGVWQIVPAALVISSLLATSLWLLRRRSPAGLLGTSFFLILLPTSSFIPIRDLAFEHRMYLPLVPVVILAVLLVEEVNRALTRHAGGQAPPLWRAGALTLVVIALSIGTFRRNGMYADPVRLWQANVALTPTHARPYNALGWAFFAQDRHEEALAAYRKALELDPFLAGAYANIGDVYWKQKRFDEAAANHRQALKISPYEFTADLHYRFGSALLELGRHDEAIAALEDAVYLDPDYEFARYNLGNAYRLKGRLDVAAEQYRSTLRINPRSTRTWVNLGMTLEAAGREDEAIRAYQEGSLTADPQADRDAGFKVFFNLGRSLVRRGRKAEARSALEAALRINPRHEAAQAALREASIP